MSSPVQHRNSLRQSLERKVLPKSKVTKKIKCADTNRKQVNLFQAQQDDFINVTLQKIIIV